MTDLDGDGGSNSSVNQRRYSGNNRNENANITLHVAKIPPHMDEVEFRKIVCDVATPCRVFLTRHAKTNFKYGFLDFTSSRDANAVLYKLNRAPPYQFHITFSTSNSEDKMKKTNKNHLFSKSAEIKDKFYRHSGNSCNNDDSGSSDLNDVTDNYSYRREVHRHKSNNFSVKNIQIIAENGHRAVTAEYEENSSSSNNDDSLMCFISQLVALDTCYVCTSDALRKCSYCNRAYCSDKCAKNDFVHHKTYCSASINGAKASSSPIERNNHFRRKDGQNYNSKSVDRRGNRSGDSDHSSSETGTSMRASRVNAKMEHLKHNGEVVVVFVDEKEHLWVVSDMDAALSLHSRLQEFCSGKNVKKVEYPTVGMRCGAFSKDENEWYRAEIISVKTSLRIKYMEYGNEEDISINCLIHLPKEFLSIDPQAFNVKLSPESSHLLKDIEMGTPLFLKPSKILDNVIIVNVVTSGKSEVLDGQKNGEQHYSDILPISKEEFTQVLICHVNKNNNTYWVQKSKDCEPCLLLLKDIDSYCRTVPPITTSDLNIGMICGVLFDDGLWYRGRILSVKPAFKVRLVDYGNEFEPPVNEIKKLKQEFIDIPSYAFKIQLASGSSKSYLELDVDNYLSVKPVSLNGDILIVHVENDVHDTPSQETKGSSKECLTLSESSSNLKQISAASNKQIESIPDVSSKPIDKKTSKIVSDFKLKKPPLPTNKFSKVVISVLEDCTTYWVSKVEDAAKINDILQNLNRYCQSENGKNTFIPNVGTLCSALFEGEWCRGEIISVKPEIRVKFIDYGNEEPASLKFLQVLPNEMASIPPLAFKVRLAEKTSSKYYNLTPFSILSVVPVNEVEGVLIVQVENEIYDDSILDYRLSDDYSPMPSPIAKTSNSTSRDIKLTQAVSDNKADNKKSIAKEVPPIPFDEFTEVVISHLADDFVYWVYKFSDQLKSGKIMVEMNSYCKSSEAKNITNPVVGTMCSALYDNDWYRGVIIDVKPALMIKFIDFGNDEIYDVSEIKTLSHELTSIPPLAFQIKLAIGTPEKYNNLSVNEKISVKPIFSAEDMWIVQIENEKYPVSSNAPLPLKEHNDSNSVITNDIPPPTKSIIFQDRKNSATKDNTSQIVKKEEPVDKIVHPISTDVFTEVVVMVPINETSYWVITQDEMNMCTKILEDLKSYSLQPLTDIKSGSKCAALYDGEWSRGKIINTNPLQVKFVDFGNVEDIKQEDVRALPPELSKLKPLAFMIKLGEDSPWKYRGLDMGAKLSVKLESKDIDNGWIVSVPESEKCVETTKITSDEQKITFRFKSIYENSEDNESTLSKPVRIKNPTIKELDNSCLPLNIYSKVNISICNDEDDYWVHLTSSLESLINMTMKLGLLSHEKVIPIMDKIYVKLYEDSWCRGKVISMNPLKIVYIDYGNEEIVDSSDLHPLPHEFINTPPFAFRIKMAKGTSDKYFNINDPQIVLNVKPVLKSQNGCYIVHVEGETYSESPLRNTINQTPRKHSFEKISENEPVNHLLKAAIRESKFDLIVNKVISDSQLSCSIIVPGQHSKLLEQINQKISLLKLNTDYSVKVGSMIGCANSTGSYCRGQLLSLRSPLHQYRVSLIDHGYTTEATSLCPLPISLENLPLAAVTCKFVSPQNDIGAGTVLNCLKSEVKGDSIECNVYGRGRCIVSKWSATDDKKLPLSSIVIPSNSPVVISAATKMCGTVYVQSVIKNNVERLGLINSELVAHVMNEAVPTTEPILDDIVACLYKEDNYYYRAQITEIKLQQNIKKYTVHFLDYGNGCEVTINEIRYLSDSMKKTPCHCVKICLEGIDNVPMIPEVQSVLNEHINSQTCFTILYENLARVKLESQGVGLSANLNKIINSTSRISGVCDKRLMLHEVKYVNWNVGAKLDIVVLSLLSHNHIIVINNKDPQLYVVKNQFTDKLSSFARNQFPSDFTYRPIIDEVIVARYEDGLWYRAYCKKETNGKYEVMFLDYGNVALISESDSRPILQEFLDVPVITKKCKIHGVPDEVSPEICIKLESLFAEGTLHEVIVTEESPSGNIIIYHPKLVSEVKERNIPLPLITLPDKI